MLNGQERGTFHRRKGKCCARALGTMEPVRRRNLAPDRPPRRRRSLPRSPPLPPCASAQIRAGNLRSSRAHPSPRSLLLTRAISLRLPRDQPFLDPPSPLPTGRARCRAPGSRPFPVSLPLTHLASVLPPFTVPEAGRSRSADGKSRSSLREGYFPKRRRKEPKLCEREGVREWRVRKKPKARIALNLRRGQRASPGNLWKGGSPGRLRLSEVADFLHGAGEARENLRKRPQAGTVCIVGKSRTRVWGGGTGLRKRRGRTEAPEL